MEQISNYLDNLKSEYFINQYGEIYSMIRSRPTKLVGKRDKDGYLEIGLYQKDGTRRHYRVHRVMGVIYLNLEMESDLEINHKNGVKDDNDLNNLEVVTSSENKLHSIHVLGNSTIGNLPNNSRSIKVFDKETGELQLYPSITKMTKDIDGLNYDYICNKLSNNEGNYFYKNRYNISYM